MASVKGTEIDELIAIDQSEHQSSGSEGYELYVAYQKPLNVSETGCTEHEIIPRTFEDALIFENLTVIADVQGSKTSEKIKEIIKEKPDGEELEDELFELLKTAEKAAFALDCLMLTDPTALKPPQYIRLGLEWFERAVGNGIAESEPKGAIA